MRHILAVIALLSVTAISAQVHYTKAFAPTDDYVPAPERPYRDAVCLNGYWRFAPATRVANGDAPPNGNAPAGSGTPDWDPTPIKIPSPWNVNSFAGKNGGDFVTYPSYPASWDTVHTAWLERDLPYKKEWTGKRLILHFEAVAGITEVYINGKKVGGNADIFLPFDIDITQDVKPNEQNHLTLKVADPALTNRPGHYGRRLYVAGSFWGQHIRGIWQDVYLLVKPPVYITGTALDPQVSKDTLSISVTVANNTNIPQRVGLTAHIQPWIGGAPNPEPHWTLGVPVLNAAARAKTIAAHDSTIITIKVKVDGKLKQWSPDQPNLYGLTIGTGQDAHYTRFGWREFHIDGKDLTLNGHPIKLRGDSWHFMGIPQMTRRYAWAWYTAMKDANLNAVRLHAEPYPSFYLDMADEMGICVLDETGMWASDGGPKIDSKEYWERADDHLHRLINRDRNHPGVFGWSVCNENIPVAVNVFHAPDSLVQRQLQAIDHWVDIARADDPSRDWISGDGETGRPTTLPTLVGHYGGEPALKQWSAQPLVWGVGESGMAYYGTPRQAASYAGDVAYVSQYGRMEGVAAEAANIFNLHQQYGATYSSVFNLVWYGLQPLELGLKDTTRAPKATDGVFFPPYKEGQPGVQPERLGPYTTTLNPGYDPSLPLYRPWPLFDAIKKGPQKITQPTPTDKATKNGTHTITLLSTDDTLKNLLQDLGVTLSDTSTLIIIDGAHPVKLNRQAEKVLIWNPPGNTDRAATSFILTHPDSLTEGLENADFYFTENTTGPVSRHGLELKNGTTLITDCNTDWSKWNNRAEYEKTAAVLRSQREAKPRGDVLVKAGNTYYLMMDPMVMARANEKTVQRLLVNFGAALRDRGNDSPLDPTGHLREAMVNGQAKRAYGGSFDLNPRTDTALTFYLYSPRSLVNLLVEPNIPVLKITAKEIRVNGKPADPNALPLEKGWNTITIKTKNRTETITLTSDQPGFIQQCQTALKPR